MTQLLSSGEFCTLCCDTVPVKVHLQTFLSIPVTQKCQILSCDALVTNERYIHHILDVFENKVWIVTCKLILPW